MTGYTGSSDFPKMNAIQPANGGGVSDIFIAKLGGNGCGGGGSGGSGNNGSEGNYWACTGPGGSVGGFGFGFSPTSTGKSRAYRMPTLQGPFLEDQSSRTYITPQPGLANLPWPGVHLTVLNVSHRSPTVAGEQSTGFATTFLSCALVAGLVLGLIVVLKKRYGIG